MKKTDYHVALTAEATPWKVFDCINRVSEWWTESLEGDSENAGGIFTVRFAETFVTFKIIENVKNKKAVWLVTDCYLHWLTNKNEWKDTKICWEIESKNNVTHLGFTHVGLIPEIECYEDCSKGWNFYIKESLLKLIKEGKGLPEKRKEIR